jgi:hypothetical protein
LASGARKTKITHDEILEQYPRSYQPAEGIVGQLRFALKYEPLDLGVYKSVFARIPKTDVERWVQSEPNSIFARRAWYLYETLTAFSACTVRAIPAKQQAKAPSTQTQQ